MKCLSRSSGFLCNNIMFNKWNLGAMRTRYVVVIGRVTDNGKKMNRIHPRRKQTPAQWYPAQ